MSNLPKHIAFIADGNRRWAKKKFLPKFVGHRNGYENIKSIVNRLIDIGIPYATFFVFSTENWNRSKEEVDYLMDLLEEVLENNLDEYKSKGIKIKVIGDFSRLSSKFQEKICYVQEQTKNSDKIEVIFALSYSGRNEIVSAAKSLAKKVLDGELDVKEIDESLFSANLSTSDIPDPDFVVRTSGEFRISNFLLWQVAYSEFIFSDKYWPDFSADDLDKAIEEFSLRKRNYGL